jgi:hypothetical protein
MKTTMAMQDQTATKEVTRCVIQPPHNSIDQTK